MDAKQKNNQTILYNLDLLETYELFQRGSSIYKYSALMKKEEENTNPTSTETKIENDMWTIWINRSVNVSLRLLMMRINGGNLSGTSHSKNPEEETARLRAWFARTTSSISQILLLPIYLLLMQLPHGVSYASSCSSHHRLNCRSHLYLKTYIRAYIYLYI